MEDLVIKSYGIFTLDLISAKFGALKALPSDMVPLRSEQNIYTVTIIPCINIKLAYVILLLLLDPFGTKV